MTSKNINNKFKHLKTVKDISEFELKKNGLKVLYKHIPKTGVITTNITYLVGARDEQNGETGVAHMLEHMLFKPTKADNQSKLDSGAMRFEREVGCVLNANTWKDRTTYYFSYGVEHFPRALAIEADRMREVVLTDKEFQPERTNVLSEFDMYNGDPKYAMSVETVTAAFHSHPYGHETIGFREDIEAYTTEKLSKFYNHFYRPNNATLMVIGDIELDEALKVIATNFEHLEPEAGVTERPKIVEPKQEGQRRFEIVRPGITNILAIGVRHGGFSTKDWFETAVIFNLLTDGPNSILHKLLVDTGLASSVTYSQEPTRDDNVGILFVTLTKKINHAKMEEKIMKIVEGLDDSYIKKQLKTVLTKAISGEVFNRDSSLDVAAELTEYVASGDWSDYFNTEKTLRSITVKDIKSRLKTIFAENNTIIGTYKSK